MTRSDWAELPGTLQMAIEAQTGLIRSTQPAPTGNHADIASTVTTRAGKQFVKAARKLEDRDGPEVRSLRNESAINPHVARSFAPRLLWQVEAVGWLALGFEHVEGRNADYSPGSPDLSMLAKTIHGLQSTACPELVQMRIERRWENLVDDVAPMAGNALLHTDLNPNNLLITSDQLAYVVDWAFTARGAAWLELGQLIPWMIMSGHSPAGAEDWACQFPSWLSTDPAAIDLYAQANAELWRGRSKACPEPWIPPYAAVIRQWADYRHKG